MAAAGSTNINTPAYWDDVYRREWEAGVILSRRDYGPMHDLIVTLVPPASRVLDIGCGPGILCRRIAEGVTDSRVKGIDFSRYTIERNAERDALLGIEYSCVDVRTGLQELQEQFDVVTMCEILEHLDDAKDVVAAAIGLVRPGGLFILTCPHDGHVPHAEHVREWGHDEVFHLLAEHARAVTFHPLPAPRDRWMLACCTTPREPTSQVGVLQQLCALGPPTYRVVSSRRRQAEEKGAASSGRFTVFARELELTPPVDWNQDPFGSRSGVYELHTLQFLDVLVRAYLEDSDLEALEQAVAVALDWVEQNYEGAEGVNAFAWYDMAVGLRAPYLAFVLRAGAMADVVSEEDAVTLTSSLRGHGRHLAAEDNYASGHNHGLFQDEGLLLLCEYLPFLEESAAWRELAWLRCSKTLRETINWEEGVHLEHSPAYHLAITHYVRRIAHIPGADTSALAGLIARLEDTAGWLVLPDGSLPQLGDTDLMQAAAWAVDAGDGKCGLKVFTGSGLAVVKEQNSFLIVSAWHHGSGHKHADELGFALYESGRCVLGDAGRYGYYEEEPARQYARSSHAHNTLIVDDESFDWQSSDPYGSGIVAGGSGAGWHAIEGVNPLLRDIDHRRLFLFSPGSLLIVVDEVRSSDPHTFRRLLHFGPEVGVETSSSGLILQADGFRGTVTDWNPSSTGWELSNGQHEPQRGWTFPKDRVAVPTWTAELSTTGAGFTSAMVIALHDQPVRVTGVRREGQTVRVSIDLDGEASEVAATSCDAVIEISQEKS